MQEEIKLICFDLNRTLIHENTWYNLNLAMGMTEKEDAALMHYADTGIISYTQAQKIIESAYKRGGKASYDTIYKIIMEYTYVQGTSEILEYLKHKGYELALISGSMDILTEHIAKDLGIKYYGANNIFIFKEGYLHQIKVVGEDEITKLNLLNEFAGKLNISLDQCVCVGDGDNDELMFEKTGKGVTFKGSKIEKSAWRVIDNLFGIKDVL